MKLLKFPGFYIFLLAVILLHSCYDASSFEQIPKTLNRNTIFQYTDYLKLDTLYEKIGEPEVNDWLFEHKESRQSFAEYISNKHVRPNAARNKIYVLPLGSFDSFEQKLIENTVEYLKIFFMLDVVLLKPVSDKIVPNASRRMNWGMEQLQTSYILNKILFPKIPADAICYVAITNMDLYPGEDWNFVFGQASLSKRIGVSSFKRFYLNKLDSSNYKLCLERIMKTTTHELCHMFTIKHCVIHKCVVNGANSLDEADNQPMLLCPECLAKLQWSVKFNVIDRYDSLTQYFAKNGFENEKQFCIKSKRLMLNM